MQKKILLSLLIASPTAMPALADINYGHGSWDVSGLGDADKGEYTYDEANGTLSCMLGSGIARQSKYLQPGTYELTFASTKNLKVEILQGGATIAAEINGGTGTNPKMSVTFEVKTAGEVVIQTMGKDATAYEFTNAELSLLFDFVAAGNVLQSQLDGLTDYAAIADEAFPGAMELLKEKTALESSKAGYQSIIDQLKDGDTPSTVLEGIYRENELFNTPSGLSEDISQLDGDIKAWNQKVDVLNTKIANTEANTATKAALEAEQNQLLEAVDQLIAEITGGPEYAKNLDLDAAKALKEEIVGYGDAISKAYADDLLAGEIKFDSQTSALQTKLDDLRGKWIGDVADWNAYNTYMNVVFPDLQGAFDTATADIEKLSGVKGHETVFDAKKAAATEVVTGIFDTAKAALKITEVKGAAALIDGAKDTVADAKTRMQAEVNGLTTLVNTQNANYDTAAQQHSEFISALKACTLETVPEQIAEAYTEMFNVVESRISGFSRFFTDNYEQAGVVGLEGAGLQVEAGTPVGDKYEKEVAEITALLATLKGIVGPAADINMLNDDLAGLKEYIQGVSDKLGTDVVDIYGLFDKADGVFESIQRGIDGLETMEDVNKQKDSITNAIDSAKANADALYAVFSDLIEADNQYGEDLVALGAFVKNKVEIDAAGQNTDVLKNAFRSAEGAGGKFEAARDKFHTDLLALNDLDTNTPQQVYDKAKEMQQSLMDGDEYYWQPDLEQIEKEFAKQVTDSNKANLDTLLQSVKDQAAEGEYAGQASIDFTAIDAQVAAIAEMIEKAGYGTEQNPVQKYADADAEIVKTVADINKVKAAVESYKQNQKDYDQLMGLLTGDTGLQAGIDALVAQNAKESKDNGKEYFDNLINGEENQTSLQAKLDAIEKALDEALAAYADGAENVTGQKAALEASIETLKSEINKTGDDITANNTYHTAQINLAETVYQELVSTLDLLETKYNKQQEIAGWYETNKAKLESLRDVDLFNNNVAVAEAYGTGMSKASDPVLTGEYNRILNEIKSIASDINDDYAGEVIKANTGTVDKAGWSATQKSMNDEYLLAIENFNSYYYGLTNAGWREKVLPIVGRHLDIYEYSQKINDLIAEVNKFVSDANAVPETFTADEFKAAATDKATALIAEMQAKVETLDAEAAAAAEEYYADLHGRAAAQIGGYESQLALAGIQSDCLAQVKAELSDAEGKYSVATDPEKATEPLGLAMDRIADNLDKALVPVDLQPVAEDAWAEVYGDAAKTVGEILAALADTANPAYKFADSELRQENAEAIAALQTRMTELNDEVSGVKEGLIDSYADYKSELDSLMSQIDTLDKAVQHDSLNNKANQDLYDSLTGTVIPDFESDLQKLLEYASTLVGGQQFNASGIRTSIDNFKQFVESNAGKLTDNQLKIDSDKQTIADAIENGYGSVAQFELKYLNSTLVPQVKVAFNDAKAAFMGAEGTVSNLDPEKGPEQINTWNDEIDSYAVEASKLNLMLGETFDKEAFRTAAQTLETKLSDLYVAMEQSWTSDKHDGVNPALTAIAELQGRYDEVAGAIEAARTYMEGCTEELDTAPFAEALTEAGEALDGEKADWEAAGNRVVGMKQTYLTAMEAIAAQVEKTRAELEAANEQAIADAQAKAANEQAYATLSIDLETLKADLERVKALAEDWYPGQYDATLEYIAGLIEAAQEDLDKRHEDVELTADSTLLDGGKISYGISSLEMRMTRRQANDRRTLAHQALIDANASLQAHFVPEELEALRASLGQLENDYDANYDKQTGADGTEVTVATLNEVIAEYERIQAAAAELKATAEENAYVPGDVELDPDGLVTAADVQQLVRWVLEGMTWEELYQENPRQAYAADLNGDQVLNVTDVSMDISWMFGEDPVTRRLARFAARATEQAAALGLELVSEENGVRRYALMLHNSVDMIAGQIDLKLPSGLAVSAVSAGERAENHSLESMEHGSDKVRVLLYSMENAAFEGNSGAVIYVDVVGNGELKVENVAFTDTFFNTHEMRGSETSFIDSVVDGAKNVGTRFYNAAGVMFNKLQNGINIFRTSDGKVKKQNHRNK